MYKKVIYVTTLHMKLPCKSGLHDCNPWKWITITLYMQHFYKIGLPELKIIIFSTQTLLYICWTPILVHWMSSSRTGTPMFPNRHRANLGLPIPELDAQCWNWARWDLSFTQFWNDSGTWSPVVKLLTDSVWSPNWHQDRKKLSADLGTWVFQFRNWMSSAGTGTVPKWGPTYTSLSHSATIFHDVSFRAPW